MTNKFEQLKNKAEEIRMTESEKSLMRSHISETMKHFPIRETAKHAQSVKSPFRFAMFARSIALVLVGFVAGGGGLAFASEQALPGDILYSIKADVVEEVFGVFQATPEAKIAWEEKRISRRSAESVVLYQKGRLDEKEGSVILNKIEKSNREIEKQVVQLAKELSFAGVKFSAEEESIDVKPILNIESSEPSLSPMGVVDEQKPTQDQNTQTSRINLKTSELGETSMLSVSVTSDISNRVLTPDDFQKIVTKKLHEEVSKLSEAENLDNQTIVKINKLLKEASSKQDKKEFFSIAREITNTLKKHSE